MSLTFVDLFCGAGGASAGLEKAGLTLRLGANHWDRAIETHAANFPDAEHLLADINHVDMRRLPRADVLWASVLCTEASPANGQAKSGAWEQRSLEEETGDHVPKPAFERTRACALDVIRATEVWNFKAIVVENVTNFITKWPLFDWWFQGMEQVGRGYHGQIVNVSSAHLWDETNAPAPQWRDRVYIVFTRSDVPIPDLAPRPIARCQSCDADVRAMQWWKNPKKRRVGAYGRQYLYRCPSRTCGHAIVEPYVAPASTAIDWTDLGIRICDRTDRKLPPLAAATLRRIRVGSEMFWQPTVVAHHGNTWERPGSDYVRAWPSFDGPLPARTATQGDALATPDAFVVTTNHGEADGFRGYLPHTRPLSAALTKIGDGLVVPFITELRGGGSNARPIDHPLGTVTTGRNHALTVPDGAFLQKHHGGVDYAPIEHMLKSPDEPMPTVVGKPNISLVIPFRRGAQPHPATARPLSAVTTRAGHALATFSDEDLALTRFRMLKPREHLRAQRFEDSYIVLGNKGEQTMLAGNAVSCNSAQWLGGRLYQVLGGAA